MVSHRWAAAELARELRIDERRRWRDVQNGATTPMVPDSTGFAWLPWSRRLELHRRRVPQPGAVWAVAMVRDEADVIGYTIEHLLGQGVQHILVADNLSTDGTNELLHGLSRRWPVTVLHDRLPAMLQEQKMTRLARLATAAGAEWIIPFDADELWCTTNGLLAETLSASPHSVLGAVMHDHVPSPDDDPEEPNPFRRIRHRLVEPKVMGKVAFRAHRLAYLEAGNHSIRHPAGNAVPSELFIRHVPFRTADQVVRKVRQGAAASDDANRSPEFSVHWRALATRNDDEVVAYYRRDGHPIVLEPAPFTSYDG